MFKNTFGPEFSNLECGLVRYDFEENGFIGIPLESVQINAKVLHSLIQVDIIQKYKKYDHHDGNRVDNPDSDCPFPVYYVFPTGTDLTVTSFMADFGHRVIKSSVQLTELAKEQYEVANNECPALFLINKQRPFMFKAGLGHLKPGDTPTISISYVTEAKLHNNSYDLKIPNTIIPNYCRSTSAPAPDSAEPIQPHVPVTLTISGYSKEKYKSVFISSRIHELIPVVVGQVPVYSLYGFQVQINGTSNDFVEDFNLQFEPENIACQHLYRERYKDENEDYKNLSILMSNILAQFDPSVESKTEFIFAMDLTQGIDPQTEKIIQALKLCVHSLPIDSYFNILSFSREKCDFLFEESQPLNVETFESGKQFVAERALNIVNAAGIFNAELSTSFKEIFNIKYLENYIRHVFFWTDRAHVEATELDEVLGVVNENAHKSRVFTLGLSKGELKEQEFLIDIAAVGGGTSMFPTNQLELYGAALAQLKFGTLKSLIDVNLKWSDYIPLDNEIEDDIEVIGQYGPKTKIKRDPLQTFQSANHIPVKIHPIYENGGTMVYGVFEGDFPTRLEVTGKAGLSMFTVQCLLKNKDENLKESDGLITTMASIRLISEWERKLVYVSPGYHSRIHKNDENYLRRQLVQLASNKHIPTKFTAYVACDLIIDNDTEGSSSNEKEYEISHTNWMIQSQYLPIGFILDLSVPTRNAGFGNARRESAGNAKASHHQPKKARLSNHLEARLALLPQGRENDDSFINSLEDVFLLIHLMGYNGSFNLELDVIKSVGLDLKIVEEEIHRHNLSGFESAVATSLVVLFLETRCLNLEKVWQLVIHKSNKWLEKNVSKERRTSMTNFALNLISSPQLDMEEDD